MSDDTEAESPALPGQRSVWWPKWDSYIAWAPLEMGYRALWGCAQSLEPQERTWVRRQPATFQRGALVERILLHALFDEARADGRITSEGGIAQVGDGTSAASTMFTVPGWHAAASYCQALVCVAISDKRVGVDCDVLAAAERIALLPSIFTVAERMHLNEHPGDVVNLWTAKESLLKLKRARIDIDPADPAYDVINPRGARIISWNPTPRTVASLSVEDGVDEAPIPLVLPGA